MLILFVCVFDYTHMLQKIFFGGGMWVGGGDDVFHLLLSLDRKSVV